MKKSIFFKSEESSKEARKKEKEKMVAENKLKEEKQKELEATEKNSKENQKKWKDLIDLLSEKELFQHLHTKYCSLPLKPNQHNQIYEWKFNPEKNVIDIFIYGIFASESQGEAVENNHAARISLNKKQELQITVFPSNPLPPTFTGKQAKSKISFYIGNSGMEEPQSMSPPNSPTSSRKMGK